MQKSLSRYWLLLGIAALAIAGLFSLALVIARTPSLSDIPLFDALFHEALVVHVDLSVLAWFLSIGCLMWSLLASGSRPVFPFIEEAALICFALAITAIAASPFDPNGAALMSNYIPVIASPVFFIGLSLMLCGVALMLVRLLAAAQWSEQFSKPMRYGIFFSALIALIALADFCWSYMRMPHGYGAQAYYDLLFWGGGHVLQLAHTQLLLVCWLLLVKALKPDFRTPRKSLKIILSIGLSTAFVTPLAYLLYDLDSYEYRAFFTNAMIMANGVAPVILAVFIINAARRGLPRNALFTSLFMSIVLFLYGGLLGGMIQGQNVIIPAHYHGSIVGVTLAFMGAAYLLSPQFGWRDVSGWKMAFWQPIVYGGGQMLHISGLAWSGGYGVLRKTPGGLDALSGSVKAAMGLMGIGGLIAIIGGFMFVVVMIKAIMPQKTE